MAARKRNQQFYVYRFVDAVGVVAYIGKGTARRFAAQQKHFSNLVGHIIQWFNDEASAYDAEARLINRQKPYLNKIKGGFGGTFGARSIVAREAEQMAKIGMRLFIARQLLKFDLTKHLSPFQIHQIKMISHNHTYLN